MGGFGRRIGDGVLWMMNGEMYYETGGGEQAAPGDVLSTEKGQYTAAEYVAIEAARMGLRDQDLDMVHAFCKGMPALGYVAEVETTECRGYGGGSAP